MSNRLENRRLTALEEQAYLDAGFILAEYLNNSQSAARPLNESSRILPNWLWRRIGPL